MELHTWCVFALLAMLDYPALHAQKVNFLKELPKKLDCRCEAHMCSCCNMFIGAPMCLDISYKNSTAEVSFSANNKMLSSITLQASDTPASAPAITVPLGIPGLNVEIKVTEFQLISEPKRICVDLDTKAGLISLNRSNLCFNINPKFIVPHEASFLGIDGKY